MLNGFFLGLYVLKPFDLCDTKAKGHVAIELLSPAIDHLEV